MSRSSVDWLLSRGLRILGLVVLLTACATPTPAPPTQSPTGAGILIAPAFEGFYSQNGGAQIFGYPISNAFVDEATRRLTQYFQNLRLEFDQSAQTVVVNPLGAFFAPDLAVQTPAPGAPSSEGRVFPETGYTVQDEFLTFYEANNGELLFGAPITPLLDEGGKLTQYFENAKLVWNPNALPAFRVELEPLADLYYWQFVGGGPEIFGPNELANILEANVRATVKEPILYAGEEQVLYVTVITPDSLNLLQGVAVSVTITYGGQSNVLDFGQTDANGQTQGVLFMPGIQPGDVVQVEVQAVGPRGIIGSAMLSFRTWW